MPVVLSVKQMCPRAVANRACTSVSILSGRVVLRWVYTGRAPKAERPCSNRYLSILVNGAKDAGLNEDYVAQLAGIMLMCTQYCLLLRGRDEPARAVAADCFSGGRWCCCTAYADVHPMLIMPHNTARPTYQPDQATVDLRKELPRPESLPPMTVAELEATKAPTAEEVAGGKAPAGTLWYLSTTGYVIKLPKEKVFFNKHRGQSV